MKTRLLSSLKLIIADRQLLVFSISILALALLYIAYVLISLQPSDVQVATHYSAFGETHYYRNKWYYLLSFVGFGVMVAVVHIMIIIKLIREEFRPLAIAFSWLSLGLLVLAFIFTHSVLGIAFLS